MLSVEEPLELMAVALHRRVHASGTPFVAQGIAIVSGSLLVVIRHHACALVGTAPTVSEAQSTNRNSWLARIRGLDQRAKLGANARK